MSFRNFLGASALAIAACALPVAASAESLREALAYAYQNNPNIASALLSVKSTAENIVQAKSGLLPTIAGSLTYSNSISSQAPDLTAGTVQAGLSYNQTLFDNYATQASVEQARAATEVATYALANAEQNVLLSVVSAYMSVIRDTQLVQLRQESVSFFQAQVQSARDRLDIGEGTRIEVSQADARLAQATSGYRAAIANLQISQATYERWVGRRPQNLTQEFNYSGLMPGSIDAAIQSAEANHPAILSASAMIRSAMAGSDAAQAAFGPTLDLVGSICAINCFGAGVTGVSGSVRLTLAIPFYSGGRLGASMRQANLNQIRSEVDALSTRDEVRESVITAWSTLQSATAQIESAQASVSSGQLVLEGTVEERDVGQSTTLDVLNSQAELVTARESLISAQTSRIIAAFSLIASTGRLNAVDLQLPVEIQSPTAYIQAVEDTWQDLRALEE